MMNLHLTQQLAQQRREAHRENAARLASIVVSFETTGSGDLIPPQPVVFKVPFFEEPTVAYGSVLRRRPDAQFYRLPVSSGGVLRWQKNERGFVLGAFLYFGIQVGYAPGFIPSEDTPLARPVMLHHLTFTGPAYKRMSPEVADAAVDPQIPPLRPPVSR